MKEIVRGQQRIRGVIRSWGVGGRGVVRSLGVARGGGVGDGVRMEGYNKGGFGCWFVEKEESHAFVFLPWVKINHGDGQRITGNQGVSGRKIL